MWKSRKVTWLESFGSDYRCLLHVRLVITLHQYFQRVWNRHRSIIRQRCDFARNVQEQIMTFPVGNSRLCLFCTDGQHTGISNFCLIYVIHLRGPNRKSTTAKHKDCTIALWHVRINFIGTKWIASFQYCSRAFSNVA